MHTRLTTSFVLTLAALTIGASPASAQARIRTVCVDGTRSSVDGRSACVRHGGVDMKATDKLDKAIVKADKQEAKAVNKAEAHADKRIAKAEVRSNRIAEDALARCKDGMYWHSKTRPGACSGHGGVSRFLKS